jgi:ATP synthase protein I
VTENDPSEGPGLPTDARLTSLDERLERAQKAEAVRSGKAAPDPNYRLGQRVLGELIGPPFGGAVIGGVIDHFAGTTPWFLLGLLFFGFGLGFRNIIRISKTPPGSGPGAGS